MSRICSRLINKYCHIMWYACTITNIVHETKDFVQGVANVLVLSKNKAGICTEVASLV